MTIKLEICPFDAAIGVVFSGTCCALICHNEIVSYKTVNGAENFLRKMLTVVRSELAIAKNDPVDFKTMTNNINVIDWQMATLKNIARAE